MSERVSEIPKEKETERKRDGDREIGWVREIQRERHTQRARERERD